MNVQIAAKSGQWEIFGTPEYHGGVPGPTDFTTLIAELAPSEQDWMQSRREPTGVTFVVPETARLWLSDPFRRLLSKNKNSGADLSAQFNCRKYQTTLKKTAQQVDGFVCAEADRLLVYLTLSSSVP